LETEENNLTA